MKMVEYAEKEGVFPLEDNIFDLEEILCMCFMGAFCAHLCV